MVSSVFLNHMTTAMTLLQLALFWILPQVNNVLACRINFILDGDLTHWVPLFLRVDSQCLALLFSFT